MKNIAIFLGAGASKSDGAPLQKELFKAYMESIERPPGRNSNYIIPQDKTKTDLLEFFSSYFGIDLEYPDRTSLFPTFEEALGILEVEGEYSGRERVRRYKEAIIASMALAIEHQLEEKRNQKDYRVIDSYHKKLVESLCENDTYKVDFLSTNYDLLIDNALLSQHQNINYAFDDSGFGINLLKLHGSLNWLYCPHCRAIQTKEASDISVKNLLDFRDQECEKCGSEKTSVIIPPTYFKNFIQYGNNIINVWSKAYRIINQADQIIFCGYSFPHADIHIKTLLKKAEQNRRRHPLLVSVFNGYKGKSPLEIQKEKRRYQRFIKQDTRLDYRGDVPFEAFAESPLAYFE